MSGAAGGTVRAAGGVLVALIVVFGAMPVRAQEPDSTRVQREHVVRDGDTLWDLAGFYLEDPFLWPVIYRANPDVVEDPHWIYPTERLIIPGLRPDRTRVAGPETEMNPDPNQELEDQVGRVVRRQPARTVFYTASAYASTRRPPPVIEEADLEGVESGDFRSAPWLDAPSELLAVARLVGVDKPGIVREDARKSAQLYDEVLLSYGGAGRPAAGAMLLLVRAGRQVGNWGRVIEPIAVLEVTDAAAELPTARIVEQFGRVMKGDVALPMAPPPIVPGEEARPVEGGPTARIIAFAIEQPLYGVGDHAFLDIGLAEGVSVGDEFQVYIPGRQVNANGAKQGPARRIAIVRVVRATDRMSTAAVIELVHPVLEPGLPVQLIRSVGE